MEGTVLDTMLVYEDLDEYTVKCGYDIRCFGYDPYYAKEFVERWSSENGPFGIVKVPLMTFCMGNCITLEDTNGNRKLYKKRGDQKIDTVAAMMDAYIAYKLNRDAFE